MPPLLRGEWRFESASRWRGARSNSHSPGAELSPEAQLLDQFSVRLHILLLEVVQKSPAAPDQLEQAAPRVVVLRMRPEVLRELVDALREERDLDLGRARVGLRAPVAPDDLQLCFLGQSQTGLLYA